MISCEISIEVNFYDRLVVVFVHHLFDLFNVFCPMSMPKSMNIFLSTAIIFQICLNDFFDKKYRFDLIFCSTTSVHFPTEEKNYRRDSNLYLSSLNLRLIFNCFQRRNITCIEQRILTYHMYSVPCIDQLCHLSFSCLELRTF